MPTKPRANGPCREPQPLLPSAGEKSAIEIANDDDTARAAATRASSPTTTADGGEATHASHTRGGQSLETFYNRSCR